MKLRIRSSLSVDPSRAARARKHFRVDSLTYLFSDRLGMTQVTFAAVVTCGDLVVTWVVTW